MGDVGEDSAGAAVLAATFRCKACGEAAETIELVPGGAPHQYAFSSVGTIVFNSGSEAMALSPAQHPRVRQALETLDPAALHAVHPRFAPMYCPECLGCYCQKHWVIEKWPDPTSDSYSMYYDTYGTCPTGHRRLMAKDSYWWP